MFTSEEATALWDVLVARFSDGPMTEYKLEVYVMRFDSALRDGNLQTAAQLYTTFFAHTREKPTTLHAMVTQFDIIGRHAFVDETRRWEPAVARAARDVIDNAVWREVLMAVEQVVSGSPEVREVRALQRTAEIVRAGTEEPNLRWVCKRVGKPGLLSVQRDAVVAHAMVQVPVLVRPHVPHAVDVLLEHHARGTQKNLA